LTQYSVLDSLFKPLIMGSKGQGSGAQGHHFELFEPPSYLSNGCSYKVQFFCTNALRAVIGCRSKIMSECGGWRRMWNIHPNALSRETWNGISVTLRTTVGP